MKKRYTHPQAVIDELLAALEPFAKLAEGTFKDWQRYGAELPSDETKTVFGDDDYIITVGDLRRAADAIREQAK